MHAWFGLATRALFTDYRRRAVLGIALMAAQAFCYNAVFFTYALILTQFYGDPVGRHRLVHAAVRGWAISSGRWCSGRCSTRLAGG